jgi:Tol biopolymer transport system component
MEFWQQVGRTRSAELALNRVYGLDMDDLNKLFAKTMRQRYWPSYGDREEVVEIARPLTDHTEENGYFNDKPAISPDGDLVAFFSDRGGFPSLYLMSAIDGKVLRRLAEGHRSSRFESLHSFRSGISFDPTGREIAFVAKTKNEETLHTMDVYSGRITRSLKLGLDIGASPAWSPDGSAIALVGTKHGRTDLYLVDLYGIPTWDLSWTTGRTWWLERGIKIIRLTDDVGDEDTPAWSPDGSKLAYAFNGRAEIDFEFELDPDGKRRLLWARPRNGSQNGDGRLAPGGSVVVLDFENGSQSTLFPEETGRHNPVWVDNHSLCVINDTTGIPNISLLQLNSTATHVTSEKILTNVLGGITHLSYAQAADRLVFSAFHAAGYDLYAADSFDQTWSQRQPTGTQSGPVMMEPPPIVANAVVNDTLQDPSKVGLVEPYSTRFFLDATQAMRGGAIYFNSAGGLGMANVLTLSDMLGNHRLRFLINFYGSFDNSDLAVSYFNLSRRINLGAGIFHYDNFYNSFIATVGEFIPRDSYLKERRYGVFFLASYPLSTFERFDVELQIFNAQRTTFILDDSGLFLIEGPQTTSRLIAPVVSFTHDSAFYGSFGPVTGTRFYFGYSPEFRMSGNDLDRRSSLIDIRKYWMPWRRNTFAIRMMGALSTGPNPRVFVLGGPFTLRGFNFYDYEHIENLSGSKLAMVNLEYRLPLLDYLIFGWPGRWGFSNIGATLFIDAGAAWDGETKFFGTGPDNRWGLEGLRANYGIGIRTLVGFLPLRFDWAWRTDLRGSYNPVFHFSIGPEF